MKIPYPGKVEQNCFCFATPFLGATPPYDCIAIYDCTNAPTDTTSFFMLSTTDQKNDDGRKTSDDEIPVTSCLWYKNKWHCLSEVNKDYNNITPFWVEIKKRMHPQFLMLLFAIVEKKRFIISIHMMRIMMIDSIGIMKFQAIIFSYVGWLVLG